MNKSFKLNVRAGLPENQNRDSNARIQYEVNRYAAMNMHIGIEMRRRGEMYFDMLTSEELKGDGEDADDDN